MKTVKRICKVCGKEFQAKPAVVIVGKGRFCSRGCAVKGMVGKHNPNWNGGQIKTVCFNCGKVFLTYSSILKIGDDKFCSKKCYTQSQVKIIKKICQACGKEIFVSPSEIKDGRGKFCSKICQGNSMTGEDSTNWKGGKIKRTCLTCKKEFSVFPCFVDSGDGNFCSRSCSAVWQIKHNKKKYTGIEIKVEEILKMLGIRYESQKVIPEGRTVADFYIPEQRLVLYADGKYWHSRQEVKNRDQKQDFLLGLNGYSVLRLGEDEINNKPGVCVKKIQEFVN